MDVSANNRRVARNTLFLYFRLLVIIVVNLVTTRVVMAQLGVTDFGIYNVVAGLVTMFAFISNSMTTVTQRYLTFELGRGDKEKLSLVFSTAINVHALISFGILVLAETIGLWFLNSEMNIPPDRVVAANWVYQFSIIGFIVSIMQLPYNSAIIAHENMNVFAYISILEAVLRLAIVYSLTLFSDNRLVIYAGMIPASQIAVRIIYQYYCRCKYEECRYHWVKDHSLYREFTAFAGWYMVGSLSWVLKLQGVNVLFNIFFGAVINAAQGVAMQIRSAIMGFVLNFTSAVNPQITKYYANGNMREMTDLTFRSLKFSFLLLLVMALPLMVNVDFILEFWLEDVPPYTGLFIILILLDCLSNALFDQPLMTSIAATGSVRNSQIVVSIIMLLILPAGYVAFKLGAEPTAVFYASIILTFIAGFVRFQFCHIQLGYSWRSFLLEVFVPSILVAVLSALVQIPIKVYAFPELPIVNVSVSVVTSIASVVFFAVLVGLSRNEREAFIRMIKAKFQSNK